MLTSKITSVTPSGTWSNGQRTFNKFRVTFANGDNLSFLAVKDFKGRVGEDLTYEKNETQQTGKVVRENNFQEANTYTPKSTNSKEDTQTYIIRQSMIKASIDFHSGQPVDLETIKSTARELINFVNNG